MGIVILPDFGEIKLKQAIFTAIIQTTLLIAGMKRFALKGALLFLSAKHGRITQASSLAAT